MISLNIEKTFGFISKASVAAYEAQVKAAQEALENGTAVRTRSGRLIALRSTLKLWRMAASPYATGIPCSRFACLSASCRNF